MEKKGEKYWVDEINKRYEDWLRSLEQRFLTVFLRETAEYNRIRRKPRVLKSILGESYEVTVLKLNNK